MSYRLGDLVIAGELINLHRHSTHGYLVLRGKETPLVIELTGDCAPDLQGKHIRFEPGWQGPDELPERPPKGLAPRQIGVTGHLSAEGWVRTFDCTTEEFIRRAELKEMPPTTWRRRLYLEWFSQNGRVMIELADPVIEVCVGEEEWKPLPHDAPKPGDPDDPATFSNSALEITAIQPDEPMQTYTFSSSKQEQNNEENQEKAKAGKDEQGLEDLQRMLDAQAASIDRIIGGTDPETEKMMAETELMYHLIEHKMSEPLASLFDEPRHLPRPEDLTDEQVEHQFKSLLMEMALCGVAFHVCEHFTWRDAYRLLVEKVFHEEEFFSQLKGSGWTQEYMTSEYCPACDAECELRYREIDKKIKKEMEKEDQGEEQPF